jgi:GNAT superfamily N-acetyltransferase
MSPTSSPFSVNCRPALARDHADVAEFCKSIWDGDDYVPEAWNDWLDDEHGLLAVAESDGHAIGCSKITLLSKGQWWLEGFRVDPKYQGRKVGSRLHEYVTDWWIENGDGTLRLMTDSQNFAVHQVCRKTGYVKTHEVCGYKAIPIPEPADHFSQVTDLREAAKFACWSEAIQSTAGLSDFGWRIVMPDEWALEAFSEESADYLHTFYWWKDRQGLFSAWANEEEDVRTLIIGVVACTLKDMPALLQDVRRWASRENFDSVFQIAFDLPQIITRLEAAGFEKKWKRSNAFVFEKEHPSRYESST